MFNITDGEFALMMARQRDQRQFDREYNQLVHRHESERRLQAARSNLQDVQNRREILVRDIEIDLRAKMDELIATLKASPKGLSKDMELALQGRLNADLRDWGIEPRLKNPQADAAWAFYVSKLPAPPPKPTQAQIESDKVLESFDIKVDAKTKTEIGELFEQGAKAKTRAEQDRIGDLMMDRIDPGWREQEKRLLETTIKEFVDIRDGVPSPVGRGLFELGYMMLGDETKTKIADELCRRHFSPKEKLLYKMFKILPAWAYIKDTVHKNKKNQKKNRI